MVASFIIIGKDDLGSYQLSSLILTIVLLSLHLIYATAWVYWRSHADFLHPIKDREKMKAILLAQLENASRNKKPEEHVPEPVVIPVVEPPSPPR